MTLKSVTDHKLIQHYPWYGVPWPIVPALFGSLTGATISCFVLLIRGLPLGMLNSAFVVVLLVFLLWVNYAEVNWFGHTLPISFLIVAYIMSLVVNSTQLTIMIAIGVQSFYLGWLWPSFKHHLGLDRNR